MGCNRKCIRTMAVYIFLNSSWPNLQTTDGTSYVTFHPLFLYSALLFSLLLCFPLGVFPLPVLALKERLDFREQDTGKSLYFVIGNPRTVVIGLLSARHGITPLKSPLVEQIALKHYAVPSDEAAPRVLGYLFGGAGAVEDDLRKHAVRSAANTEIHVVAYLAGDDGRIRSLRGKDEVDTERSSLPCNGGQLVFNLRQQLLGVYQAMNCTI